MGSQVLALRGAATHVTTNHPRLGQKPSPREREGGAHRLTSHKGEGADEVTFESQNGGVQEPCRHPRGSDLRKEWRGRLLASLASSGVSGAQVAGTEREGQKGQKLRLGGSQ